MNRNFDLVLTLLTVIITLFGWVTSKQAKERVRRDPRRPFSLSPRVQGDTATGAPELPPTNWPDWATGKTTFAIGKDDDLDEGLPVEQAPDSAPAQAAELAITDMIMPVEDEDEMVLSSLLKAVIWSEILQPPLALRYKRR